MHPYFTVGTKISIPAYGICLALGFLISLCVYHRLRSTEEQHDILQTTLIATALIVTGLTGAALLGLLVHGFQRNIPLVFYGGVILSWLIFPLITKRMGLDRKEELDYIVVALLPGQAIGRVGCLMAGCCYGKAYNGFFSTRFFHPLSNAPIGQPLLPVQLIEAICDISLFLHLFKQVRYKRKGNITVQYLLLYSLIRFFIEFLRGDISRGFVLCFSTSQWISLFIMLITIGLWIAGEL